MKHTGKQNYNTIGINICGNKTKTKKLKLPLGDADYEVGKKLNRN